MSNTKEIRDLLPNLTAYLCKALISAAPSYEATDAHIEGAFKKFCDFLEIARELTTRLKIKKIAETLELELLQINAELKDETNPSHPSLMSMVDSAVAQYKSET